MRERLLIALVLLGVAAGTAAADDSSPQISADAPIAGLPAVSKDGGWFARPVRVQPSGCKGIQTYVEVGTIGGPSTEHKGDLLLVRDECATGDAIAAKNITKVNDTLRGKIFRSVGTTETRALPTTVEVPEGKVTVDATGKNHCIVSVDDSAADRWTVTLDGPVTEVRGWYSGKNSSGAGYISVLVATKAKDTEGRGRERWVDFWPIGTRSPGTGDSPVEIATAWIKALKKGSTDGLMATSSTPFWKVGLTPTGSQRKSCKSKQKAKNEDQLEGVVRCIAVAGQLYSGLADADAVAEMELAELPDELRKHKRAVTKLVKQGHKLVRYHVNADGYFVYVILVLDPDTDFQTVNAALESFDRE